MARFFDFVWVITCSLLPRPQINEESAPSPHSSYPVVPYVVKTSKATNRIAGHMPPFQGLGRTVDACPRALPWAFSSCPFGA